jgi:hypothetical protein
VTTREPVGVSEPISAHEGRGAAPTYPARSSSEGLGRRREGPKLASRPERAQAADFGSRRGFDRPTRAFRGRTAFARVGRGSPAILSRGRRPPAAGPRRLGSPFCRVASCSCALHARPGQVRSGQVRPSQVRPSQVRPSQVRLSQVRLSQVRLSQVRLSQVRPSQVRLAEGRSLQSASWRSALARLASHRTAPCSFARGSTRARGARCPVSRPELGRWDQVEALFGPEGSPAPARRR